MMNKPELTTPVIAIVVPCYNEQESLPETAKKLSEKITRLMSNKTVSEKSTIVFVDDGSEDNTWNLIEKYHIQNPLIFGGLKLSRNKGHQNALLSGLLAVRKFADAVISIDADLQDDIEVIDKMIARYVMGYEIVYGVRSQRKTDNFFKRSTAQSFYRFMRFLGADTVFNHADFRLMGKTALNALSQYKEVNLFLRGIVPLLGYKTCIEYYKRYERLAGNSKYPFSKMFQFAFEGITSFSVKPIRYVTLLGVLVFTVSLAMLLYFFIRYFTGFTVDGWASIVCSIWGIGGLTIFSIGIIGEYIGKIYLEVKQRPRYHIERFLYGGSANE
jgi:glycosyltransferase involved in cell wall biosynthesis